MNWLDVVRLVGAVFSLVAFGFSLAALRLVRKARQDREDARRAAEIDTT